jgi:tRNA U34 2-thiouridine synthase MnmA/TrmU
VELHVVHLTDEYWKLVVSHSISEIQAGQTPNPDILCNSRIKFGAFLQNVEDAQFDRIASGHYARVERAAINGDFVGARLLLSADQVKDQTYFLSHLTQAQLSRLMFPLGGLTKVSKVVLFAFCEIVNRGKEKAESLLLRF